MIFRIDHNNDENEPSQQSHADESDEAKEEESKSSLQVDNQHREEPENHYL